MPIYAFTSLYSLSYFITEPLLYVSQIIYLENLIL